MTRSLTLAALLLGLSVPAARAEMARYDLDPDHVLVTATVRDTEQLRWWLLAFGDLIEVLAPNLLRSAIANTVRECSLLYSDS